MKRLFISVLLIMLLLTLAQCNKKKLSDTDKPYTKTKKSESIILGNDRFAKNSPSLTKGKAIITDTNGLPVRDKPSKNGVIITTLPYKGIVTISRITTKTLSVNGKKGKWVEISFYNPLKDKIDIGFVYEGFLYTKKDVSGIELKKEYILSIYPKLDIRKGPKGLEAKTANGSYVKISLKDEICDGSLLDYVDELDSYYFQMSCDGESNNNVLLNYKTGSLIHVSSCPVFNTLKSHFYTINYPKNEDGLIMIYKMEGDNFREESSSKLNTTFNRAFWKNDYAIELVFGAPDRMQIQITITYNDSQWENNFSHVDIDLGMQILSQLQEFTEEELTSEFDTKDGLYFQGLARINLNERVIFIGDNKIPVKELITSNNKLDSEKIKKIFTLLYNPLKENKNKIAAYYSFYNDMIKTYLKLYLVMINEIGKEQLLRDYKNALDRADKTENKTFMIDFYKQYMIDNSIDLKANVMHRKRNYVAVGFWMRRLAEGTADTCFLLSVKCIKEFDKDFYNGYITGNALKDTRLNSLPAAMYDNQKVRLISRRIQFDYLDYEIEINGQRKWVSAYDLEFLN